MKKIQSALELSKVATPSSPDSDHTRVYAKSDGLLYYKNSDGVETAIGTGSSVSYNTYIAALSGLVHRWKFDEASGNFADSVGSLTLTASGAFTYQQSSRVGTLSAVKLGASAKGQSTGLGSIPTGAGERTIVCVYKPASDSKECLWSYGTNSLRQWCGANINDGSGGNLTFAVWSDDVAMSAVGCNIRGWHIMIALVYASAAYGQAQSDGNAQTQRAFGAALATASAGNFVMGQQNYDGGGQGTFYIDDLAVFSRALEPWEIRALINALS